MLCRVALDRNERFDNYFAPPGISPEFHTRKGRAMPAHRRFVISLVLIFGIGMTTAGCLSLGGKTYVTARQYDETNYVAGKPDQRARASSRPLAAGLTDTLRRTGSVVLTNL